MKAKKQLVVYPLLFAIYPVVFLYSKNMEEAAPIDALRLAGAVLIVTALMLALCRRILRDDVRAGVLVTIILVMFFSYGAVFSSVFAFFRHWNIIIRNMLFYPMWCLLLIVVAIMIVKTHRRLEVLSSFLSAVGIILLATCAIQMGSILTKPGRGELGNWKNYVGRSCQGSDALRPNKKEKLPDIYYLIFDRYTRADVLSEDYNLDTNDFLQNLRRQGFYVASKSNSNYAHTHFSLASSLNLDYLDPLARRAGISTITSVAMQEMIRDSRVMQLLNGVGYKVVYLPSDYQFVRIENPDIVIKRGGISLSEFGRVLLDKTMLRILNCGLDGYKSNLDYALDHLSDIPGIKEPTITFAHIAVTHDPYVYDENGNTPKVPFDQIVNPGKAAFVPLYVGSVIYTNKQIEKIVKEIISKSSTPPIIILQADHGQNFEFAGEPKPGIARATCIFNALYLPKGGDKLLYPSITPVNTFRLIFNKYYGMHYKLLQDTVFEGYSKGSGVGFRAVSR